MVTGTESVVVSSSAVVGITSVVVAEKITKFRYYFFKLSVFIFQSCIFCQPSTSGAFNLLIFLWPFH